MAAPKRGVAYSFDVTLISSQTLGMLAAPPIAAGDFKISTDEGAFVNLATLPVVAPGGSVQVKVSLSAAEMDGDRATMFARDPDGVWNDLFVAIPIEPGEASDPLLNAVPGAYASGTAGAALGKIGSGRITTVSPVAQGGDIELVRGDDYMLGDGRALEWTDESAAWPELPDAEILLGVAGKMVAGSVVTATGVGKKVRVELNKNFTSSLKRGGYRYQVQATLADGHVVTLVQGTARVWEDLAV